MENGPFEDVFPIKNWDIPIVMLVYQRVLHLLILKYFGPGDFLKSGTIGITFLSLSRK